ncbi:hypothetical protein [Paraburkholderia acidisoli]|uniref:Uncharacterized protein n=1 Tax=Paraburkholderia acidisoli TaxID=2571748 RepID=A0A7Z2GQH4_9BURK|nr:hypothetical protein [Paraburkholderia acidisoli]QGZ66121.1 hypothetical protein FAZ98_30355 [Paraburkholderia acidisoli]
MQSETELREHHASLQQRAQRLASQGQSRVDRLAAPGSTASATSATSATSPQEPDATSHASHALQDAKDEAAAAVQCHRQSGLFLETANSLFESLAAPSPSSDDDEWREQLLFRAAEVLETAADLIDEGETHLQRSINALD